MDDNLIIINEVIKQRFDEAIKEDGFITEIEVLLKKAGEELNKCIEDITVNKTPDEKNEEYYNFINNNNNNNNLDRLINEGKITATRSYGLLTKSKRQYHITNFNLKSNSEESFTNAFLILNEIREKLVGTSYISLAYSDENNREVAPNKFARVPLSELVEAGMVGKDGKSLKVRSPKSLQEQIEKNNISEERREKIKNIFNKSQNIDTKFLNFIRRGLEIEYNVSELPNTKIHDVDLGYNADLFELYLLFTGTAVEKQYSNYTDNLVEVYSRFEGTDVEKQYPNYSNEHMSGKIWAAYLRTITNKRDSSSAIKFGERGTTTEAKTQSSKSHSKYMGHALISFEQLLIQYTVLYNIIYKSSTKVDETEQIFHMYKLYTNKEDYESLADHIKNDLHKTFNKNTNLTR